MEFGRGTGGSRRSPGFSGGQVTGKGAGQFPVGAGQFYVNGGATGQIVGPGGVFDRQRGDLGANVSHVGFGSGQILDKGGIGHGQGAGPGALLADREVVLFWAAKALVNSPSMVVVVDSQLGLVV